jgi:hypothetical protein
MYGLHGPFSVLSAGFKNQGAGQDLVVVTKGRDG